MSDFTNKEKENSKTSNADNITGSSPVTGVALAPPPYQIESENNAPSSNANLDVQQQEVSCHQGEVGLDERWERFYEIFNTEFRSILHSFDNHSTEEGSQENTTRGANVGEQSGQNVCASELASLFTNAQRDKLITFHESRAIPDRLFNVDEVGNTTAQQRILMSSHILSQGTYQPGSFIQGVHARMCYHWVRIVHHYAGATTIGNNRDLMGSFDHNNNIVLGMGQTQSIHDESSHRVSTDILPIPEGTSHARREAEGKRVHRAIAFPMERFNEIQPGDWIWCYNANGSGSGAHSVIFSHWIDIEPRIVDETISYRQAVCFSQGRTKDGGREHTVRFGAEYNDTPRIWPITSLIRVPENTNPAASVEDIVGQGNRTERRSASANSRFINRVCRRYGFLRDEEHIESYVQEIKLELRLRNDQLILSLNNITERQRSLLQESNKVEVLHELVRLYQRLEGFNTNQKILEENHESRYEKLNPRHENVSEDINNKHEEIQEKIEAQRLIIAPNEQRLEEIEEELGNLSPSTRSLNREIQQLIRQRRTLERGSEEKRAVQDRINESIGERDRLRGIARENRSKVNQLRQERARLRSASRRPNNLIKRYERQLNNNQGRLPYGSVHTGSLRRSNRSRARGKLQDVYSYRAMKEIIQRAQSKAEHAE